MSKQHFTGFGTAKDFIEAVDREKPINLEAVGEPSKGDRYGLQRVRQFIVLSQVQGPEVIYWRGKVGSYVLANGELYPGDTNNFERVQSAVNLTIDLLKKNGLDLIRRAVVSFPTNYRHIDGSIDFMEYDKETDRFVSLEGDSNA